MKGFIKTGAALALLAASASALAQGQQHKPTMEEKFSAANVSGSKCLTYEEARAARLWGIVKQFQAIDIAHQGCVTLPEIRAYRHGTRNLDVE